MGKREDVQRINEEIAARFSKIEADISAAGSIAGLFEVLVDRIEREFSVPFVWLTLIDRPTAVPLIEAVNASEILKGRLCVVSSELCDKMLPKGLQPILANKDLQSFYKLMPSQRKYFVRSLAIVPFALGGQIIGTWNNGDADADRYTAQMDTALLSSLARRISAQLMQLAAAKHAAPDHKQDNEQPGGLHG